MAAARPRHALSGEANGAPVLRFRRDTQRDPAFQRRHGHFPAEQRLVHRDRQIDAEIVAVAREERMRLHAYAEVRVAGWSTVHARISLPRKPDALAILDAGWDFHGEPSRGATVLARDLDHVLGALVGLRESDLDLALDIFALTCARAGARTRAAEEVIRIREPTVPGLAEERPEEIREPADVVGRGVLRNAKRLVVVLVLDRHPFRPRKLVRWRGRWHARTCRLDLRGRNVRSGQERRLEHLVDGLHELDVDRVDDLLWDVHQVLLVLLRHEEDLDPGTVRREQLLLHTADGQDEATERDLAGHGDVLADLAAGERRDDGRRHGHAGRGAVLRD